MNTEIDRMWLYPLLVIYTLALPSNATRCSSGKTSTSIVRLVGGAVASEGRLEVLYNGTWGTVCNDYFWYPDGLVVCRQLGYNIGVKLITSTMFGAGKDPIWMDDVGCTGSEESILNCTHRGFGVHNCDHTDDVGIICDPCAFNATNMEDGAVRLAGGNCYSNGRVEIFHEGEWGTVCTTRWDLNDAVVVCRQLGFQGALEVPPRSHYGPGVGTIWLSNVGCTGSESRLDECDHSGWGEASWCFHNIHDASVKCEGENSILPSPTPPQIGSSFHTCIIPSSVAPSSPTVLLGFSRQVSTMLPVQSSSPTLPTASDVGDDLSSMELILGLVALGVLLLTSAILLSIVITVCVCRSKRSKSVQVENFQSAQSAGFPPIAGLVGGFEDSEVVLTNTNTQLSNAHTSHS